MGDFESFVQALMAPDNDTRNEAEAQLAHLKEENADELLANLTEGIRTSGEVVVRSMSAIVLRRILTQDEVSCWGRLTPDARRGVQSALLEHLIEEDVKHIRTQVIHAVAGIGMITLEDNEWPELMPWLYERIHGEHVHMKEVALRLFEELAYYIASCMQDKFSAFLDVFGTVMSDDSLPLDAHVAAFRASCSLVMSIELVSERPIFAPLVPLYINTINRCMTEGDGEKANECLSVLIDLVEDTPALFKEELQPVLDAIIGIAANAEIPQQTRHLAVEFCNAIAEAAPYYLRKLKDNWFALTFFPVIFDMMTDLSDDPEWENKTDDDDERYIRNVAVGEESLDRITDAVGGKTLMPILNNFFQEMFAMGQDESRGDDRWRFSYAALMGIAQSASQLEESEEELVGAASMVAPYADHPHPRVRYATMEVVGMLADTQAPSFQFDCHELVLPMLKDTMTNTESPRCQGHAAKALTNFVADCDPEIVQEHVSHFLGILTDLIGSAPTRIKGLATVAISALADCLEEDFGPYYPELAGILKEAIGNCTESEHRELRGQLFEAIATAGYTAGPEEFHDDALEIMSILREDAGLFDVGDDDPQRMYIWQAIGKVAITLGEEFAPYLDFAIPSLLSAAKNSSEMVPVKEGDRPANFYDSDEEAEALHEVRRGKEVFRVRTAALDEKVTALRILLMFAGNMKEQFWPYALPTTEVILPLLEYTGTVYADAKSYSMSLCPALCHSMAMQFHIATLNGTEPNIGGDEVMGSINTILKALLDQLVKEKEIDLLMTLVQTIKISVEQTCVLPRTDEDKEYAARTGMEPPRQYRPFLDGDQLALTTARLRDVLQHAIQRRSVRHAQATVDHEDVDEEEEMRIHSKDQIEHELMWYCVDAIGMLLKTHKDEYIAVFSDLMKQKVEDMINPACIPEDRKLAIFLIDDVLEHAGPAAAEYVELFAPMMLDAAGDDDIQVRQAGCYGLGAAAVAQGPAWGAFLDPTIEALTYAIQDPKLRKGQAASVHDNAVTALGKILLKQEHDAAPSNVAAFVGGFPLRYDVEESRIGTVQLCDLLEGGNPTLLSDDGAALGETLNALAAQAVTKKVMTASLTKRISEVVQTVQGGVSTETWDAAWGSLAPEAREIIERLVEDPEAVAKESAEAEFDEDDV